MQPDAPLAPSAPMPPEAPEPATPARSARIRVAVAASAALAVACASVGIAFAVRGTDTVSGTGTAIAAPSIDQQRLPQSNGTWPGRSSTQDEATASSTDATAAQSVGVVDIVSVLGYQGAESAGTGMVVTSAGEILTNNHVIDGATSITVTVVSTGTTYKATVVGTDPSDDVAVLRLANASGLATANFGDSDTVDVGEKVTGVGNAGGTGGTPNAATGTVLALDQTLTASDNTGSNSETLTGMIESNAAIAAGDSGGPLYDADGKVVGMDTAAATHAGTTVAAYSIPIDKALSIVAKIDSGQASSTIHIGGTGFLGVSVTDSTQGAVIAQVVSGGPAATAGLSAGDVITAVGSTAVRSAAGLKSALAGTEPGDQVTLHWTDASGATHSAAVTLTEGPAD